MDTGNDKAGVDRPGVADGGDKAADRPGVADGGDKADHCSVASSGKTPSTDKEVLAELSCPSSKDYIPGFPTCSNTRS